MSSSNKIYTEKDLRRAFEFYAYATVSQQPYNDKELEGHFEKFKKILHENNKKHKQ